MRPIMVWMHRQHAYTKPSGLLGQAPHRWWWL